MALGCAFVMTLIVGEALEPIRNGGPEGAVPPADDHRDQDRKRASPSPGRSDFFGLHECRPRRRHLHFERPEDARGGR